MSKLPRTVLGIDCGSALVGWAVLEQKGNKLKHIDYGDIRTSKDDDMPLRLKSIFRQFSEIIKRYKPDEMAVEEIFFFKNQKTIIPVAQARGVTVLAGAEYDLPVYGYTPPQVKVAVTGYGRAEKKQVQFMVSKILGLKEIPKPDDVADAIAVGICHLNSNVR
ncbi:MAG: crossover junction endodeoxyribonuclease RuvC [Candidatus Dojkabacteria bacterium]